MAFIIEQAGGLATTGTTPVLDLEPESIHQRVPCFIGSKDDVEDLISFFKEPVQVSS
jgi:fructose-1,6-bisphosphatase I